jgi:serine/threonine protein kinase
MSTLEAGVRIGDFRIERRLGAGGMGIVYLARQVSLDRRVALKTLGGALNRKADIARFQREAQAVAKLNHPGIATVYFVGQDDQLCYMAMEFIDGVSLRKLIDRLAVASDDRLTIESAAQLEPLGEVAAPTVRFDDPTETFDSQNMTDDTQTVPEPLSRESSRMIASRDFLRRCCEIIRDAATALAHAHERGVVHRDVKPENLMVDRRLDVHVIDFGIARFFEDTTLTVTGALIGTPMYMSPEQVTGCLKVDHRTDIYSLGMVLYEFLTLRRPITDQTREGVLRQIVTKPLPPVSWKNRAIPRDLEAVVHKATAKDPDERYQSASGFARDLQNWLDGRPVTAQPYRYRFDVREVVAARPPGIVLAGTWVFFGALYCLMESLQGLWVTVSLRGIAGASWKDLFVLMLAILYSLVGRGLLLGQTWSRWVGVALGLFNLGLFGSFIYSISYRSGKFAGSYWFPLFVLIMACWIATLATLLRRRTGDWFRLVSRLRAEHQRHASPR